MAWKASNVMQIFQSRMLEGLHALKEVCWLLEKMLHQSIEDVYIRQKMAVQVGAGYAILVYFADPLRVTKKLLEKAGLARN